MIGVPGAFDVGSGVFDIGSGVFDIGSGAFDGDPVDAVVRSANDRHRYLGASDDALGDAPEEHP